MDVDGFYCFIVLNDICIDVVSTRHATMLLLLGKVLSSALLSTVPSQDLLSSCQLETCGTWKTHATRLFKSTSSTSMSLVVSMVMASGSLSKFGHEEFVVVVVNESRTMARDLYSFFAWIEPDDDRVQN